MTIHIEMWRSNADRTSVQVGLTHRVWEELRAEPGLDVSALQADVADYVATLAGTVPRLPDRLAAERAAKRVPGVEAVVNHVTVAISPADRRGDAEIARAADHALEWNTLVPRGRVRASVADGWVTLEGVVEAQYQREAAEECVGRLVGVRGMSARVAVTSHAGAEQLQARIADALRHHAQLRARHIRVEAAGDGVVLRGRVRSLAERDEAEHVALGIPGVNWVRDALKVKR